MVCQDEGAEKTLAVYERLTCQGVVCVYNAERSGYTPGMTWLCEVCAVLVDINKQGVIEEEVDKVKRNFVCQCPTESPCLVETFMVSRLEDGTQQVFKCSRKAQVALVLNGPMFFEGMPSMEDLAADPSCLSRHARACVCEETAQEQPVIDSAKRMRLNDAVYGAATGWPEAGDGCGRWEVSYKYKVLSVKSCFNVDFNNGVNSVSLQMIKAGNAVRLVAATPKSTVKITAPAEASRALSKGICRGSNPRAVGRGVSSAGCTREMSDRNGEGTVSYLFALGGEGPISIEADVVVPVGGMACFFKSLRNEAQFAEVPTFVPVPKIDVIETNVLLAETDKIVMLRALCVEHGCKYDDTSGPYFALLDVDTGEERLFQGIGRCLEVTGFGTNASWQWQMVVFRQGTVLMTLYILVAQIPYPGLWVIVHKTDAKDGSASIKMVGEDMAPWGQYVDPATKKTFERGLWTEHGMRRWYLGFTKTSDALMKCLNTDTSRFGPLVRDLIVNQALSVDGVHKAFGVQAAKVTALFAENLRTIGGTFFAQLEENEKKGTVARKRLTENTRFAMGGHGRVAVTLRVGKNTALGSAPVFGGVVTTDGTPTVAFVVKPNNASWVHFLVSKEDPEPGVEHVRPFTYDMCSVDVHGDVGVMESRDWTPGAWERELSTYPPDAGEREEYLVRRQDTGRVLLRMYVTTSPELSI